MKASSLNSIARASALAVIVLFPNAVALGDVCAAPSFAAARKFPAPGCTVSVAVADFNADGKLDLVLGTIFPFDCCTYDVPVLLGNGDGTFLPAVNNYAGPNPRTVAAGDFNGDGRLDLVVGNRSFANVFSVMLGNGDGTFQHAASFGERWIPRSMATGDLNGDGKLDLAAVSSTYSTGSSTYTNGSALVLLGNGDGSFQSLLSYNAGIHPSSVAVGDFNRDGHPDLAVGNSGDAPAFTNGNVSVLLGNGDGTFRTAVNYVTGADPVSVAVGDFNGDGKPDLTVANYGSGPNFTNGGVSVLLGNGDGILQAAINSPVVPSPYAVTAADFNGDGHLDVAVSHTAYASGGAAPVSAMLGKGDGTFQSAVSYSTEAFLRNSDQTLALGDFNGDGRPDLAVAVCSGAAVLLNTCPNADVRLAVARTNDTLTLSWMLPYTNFVLESTTSLGSTSWQGDSAMVTTNNGQCEVTVPLDQPQRYFRLRKT